MPMVSVARIEIGTRINKYQILVPEMDLEGAKALMLKAKEQAQELMEQAEQLNWNLVPASLVFHFENEYLEINEDPDYVHYFIKTENYGFTTPDIRVHKR